MKKLNTPGKSLFSRLRSNARRNKAARGRFPSLQSRRRILRAELLEDRRLLAGDLQLVADLRPGGLSSDPNELVAIGDSVYFVANDGSGDAIWRHIPASGETEKLQDPSNAQTLRGFDLQGYQGTLLFGGLSGSEGLYSYEVSSGTISQLSPIYSGEATVAGSSIYFRADDGIVGEEIWRYDAGGGVTLVVDLDDGPSSSFPTDFTYDTGILGFWSFYNLSYGKSLGENLYRFNTAGGSISQEYSTVYLVGQFPPSNMAQDTLAAAGNLYYPAVNAFSSVFEDRELEVSGSAININSIEDDVAALVHVDPSSFYTSSDVADLVYLNGKVYLTATRTVATFEGVAENGDTIAVDIGGNPLDPNIFEPILNYYSTGSFEFRGIVEVDTVGNSFEFVVGNRESELDAPFFDLAVNGGFMTSVGDKLLFVDQGTYGNGGFWTFDPATRQLERVLANSAPSQLGFSPAKLAKLGSFAYLTANAASTGRELYRLELNAPPVAVNDEVNVYTNVTSIIAVLEENGNGLDSDPDGNSLVIDSVTQPASGTVVVNANQTVSYTPYSPFSGNDQFTYTISDGFGGSATATVTLDVQPAPPIATDDNFAADEDSGFVSTTGLLANDTDPNSTPFQVTAINGVPLSTLAGPEIATATPDSTLPIFTSSLDAENYYGFRFEVTEPTTIARVGGNFKFISGTGPFAALVGLTGPTDVPDSEDLSTSDVVATTVIPLAYQQDGVVSTELNADLQPGWYAVMYGTQKFGSTGITNMYLNSAPLENVSFIHSQPMVPRFLSPSPASKIPNARLFVKARAEVIGDVEVALPSGAIITVSPTGDFAYDPRGVFNALAAGQLASDGFSYEITNDTGQTTTANAAIVIIGNNDLPTVSNQSFALSEQLLATRTAVTGMLKDAVDPDSDVLSIDQINGQQIVSGVPLTLQSGAILIPNADGSFSYDPRVAFNGLAGGTTSNDGFQFTATDGNGGSAIGLVEITINGINDPTVWTADDAPIVIDQGETASLSGTVFDPEGSVTLSASLGEIAADASGKNWLWRFRGITALPAQSVVLTATDSDGQAATFSFQLTVNDLPTLTASIGSSVINVDEGESFHLAGTYTDSQTDSTHQLTITWDNFTGESSSFLLPPIDSLSIGDELWDATLDHAIRIDSIQRNSSDLGPVGYNLQIFGSSNPRSFYSTDEFALFVANDGVHGKELWIYDAVGPRMLADLNPSGDGVSIPEFTSFGGEVYFIGNDGASGYELWKTDGTASGTERVLDLRDGGPSYITELTVFDGALFFVGIGNDGKEWLWKSDGTAAGTAPVPLADASASALSTTGNLSVVGERLFFRSSQIDFYGITGEELFALDSASDSVRLVKNIRPGSSGSWPNQITDLNGTAFFEIQNAGARELWKSDGTEAGTAMVSTFGGANLHGLKSFTVLDGALLFGADDGIHGYELWRSDGTTAGTAMVIDINPAGEGFVEFDLGAPGMTTLDGKVFFQAQSQASPYNPELWYSDGTAAGTGSIEIRPGIAGSGPIYLTRFGDEIFFRASDGMTGNELWRTDGTVSGTTLVQDTIPGGPYAGLRPAELVAWGGSLLMIGYSADNDVELYVYNPPENRYVDVSFSTTHTYADDRSSQNENERTIALTIENEDSDQVSVTTPVTVANVVPTILELNLSNDSILQGETLTLSGIFQDVFTSDWHEVVIDWGDGSTTSLIGFDPVMDGMAFSATHQYALGPNADVPIQVTVSDDDGGIGTTETSVFVGNIVPTITSLSTDVSTIDEGQAVTLFVEFVDADEPHEVIVNWGDGGSTTLQLAPGVLTATIPRVYSDDNPTATPIDVNEILVEVRDAVSFVVTPSRRDVFERSFVDLQQVSGPNDVSIVDVSYGADGSYAVLGEFTQSSVAIPDGSGGWQTLDSAGGKDWFVAYYSSTGLLNWVHNFGGWFDESGLAIETDSRGNLVVCGGVNSSVDVDPGGGVKKLPNGHGVITLNSQGELVQAFSLGVSINDIAIAGNDDIILGGRTFTERDFDPSSNETLYTPVGGGDAFLARYTADGTFQWVRGFGGADYEEVTSVDIAGDGRIVAAGQFSGTTDLNAGLGTDNHTSNGSYDIFVASYTSDGDYEWGSTTGGTSVDIVRDIAVDRSGVSYVATQLRGPLDIDPGPGVQTLTTNGYDAVVWTLGSDGSLKWIQKFTDSGNGRATGIAISPNDGNVVMTGTFDSSINIDGQVISGTSLDVFLTVLNPFGEVQYASSVGGAGFEQATGVAVSAFGSAAVFGSFGETASDSDGSITLNSAGGYDGFLATYSIAPAIPYGPLVTVSNLLPSVSQLSLSGDPGNPSRIVLTADVADPSLLDSMTAIVSWGDDTESIIALPPGATHLNVAHQYIASQSTPINGIYDVSVRLLDDDGGEATASSSIAVLAEPEITFESVNLTVQEDAGIISLPIRMSVASSQAITIPVILTGTASNGADYTVATTVVTIPSGETTAFFEIAIEDDNIDELNPESIIVALGETAGVIIGRTPIQTVTILDNDTATLSLVALGETSNWEDVGTVQLQANLTIARDTVTQIPLAVSGTALEETDFSITSPNIVVGIDGIRYLEFPANVTQVPLFLHYLDDNVNEPANNARETVELFLDATGLPIQASDVHVRYVIFDNDPIVYLGNTSVTTTVYRGGEGDDITIPIYLSAPTNKSVSVSLNYSGYGSAQARKGTDYSGLTSIVIPGYSSGLNLTVPLFQDNIDEPTERLLVKLGALTNGVASATAGRNAQVIIDDDDTAKASINVPTNVREGKTFPVTVSLSTPSAFDSVITFTMTGTATRTEYTLYSGTGFGLTGLGKTIRADYNVPISVGIGNGPFRVKIPAGRTSVTFNVGVNQDEVAEGDETIRFSLRSATGGVKLGNGDTIKILANAATSSGVTKDVTKQSVIAGALRLDISSQPSTGTPTAPAEGLFTSNQNLNEASIDQPFALQLPRANGAQGLLSGSTVFLDANFNQRQDYLDLDGNGVFSEGDLLEPSLRTELDGSVIVDFSTDFDLDGDGFIDQNEAQLVLTGGIDTSTDQDFDGVLTAPTGYFVISPLSTLLSQLMQAGVVGSDEAEARLFSALQLADFNLASTNYIWDSAASSFSAGEAYRADVHIANTVRLISALFESADSRSVADISISVYRDLAEKLLTEGSVARFSDPAFISSVIRGVAFRSAIPVNDAQVNAASEIIVGINQQAEDAENTASREFVDRLAILHKTAETSLVPAVQTILSATDPASVAASATGSNLQASIAATAVFNVLPPELYVSDVAMIEGANGTNIAQVTVALVGATDVPVSVSYGTADGTASTDDDYIPTAGTLTWLPGDAQNKTIDVLVRGDSRLESDEAFTVQFFEADGLVMRHEFSQIYILNDEAVEFSVADETQPVALRMVVDYDLLEIYQNDVLVFNGEYAGEVPITIIGSQTAATTLEIEIANAGPLLAGGITFVGGASLDDSLVLLNSVLEGTTYERNGVADGRFLLPAGMIAYSGIESVTDTLTAEIAYDGNLLEGSPIAFAAENIAFPLQPEDAVSWTVERDGIVVFTSNSASDSFEPDNNGNYTVTLAVVRDGSGVGTTRTAFSVTNVAPILEAGEDESLPSSVAGNFARQILFADPGADTWTGTVDYGDGSPIQPLAIDPQAKRIAMQHDYASEGSYTVRMALNDGVDSVEDSFSVTVRLNEAPVAVDDVVTGFEDIPTIIEVFADNGNGADYDPNGDALTVVSTTGPAHGSVVVNDDGTLTYIPVADFFGSDSFEYTIADEAGATSIATVYLTVTATNDAPTVAAPLADVTVDEDAPDQVIDLSGVFADIDSANIAVSAISSDGSLLTATIDGTDLTLSFASDQNGAATVTVTASDGELSVSDTFAVNVNAINDAPTVAAPLADVTVDEDAPDQVIDLSGVFADIDSANLTLSATSSDGSLVTATIDGTDLTLSFASDQNGAATITVTASDGELSVSDTFAVNVNAINDAPISQNGTAAAIEDGAAVAGQLVATDVEEDATWLTYSLVSGTSEGTTTVNPDGSFSFNPGSDFQDLAAGETRNVSFVFQVRDRHGAVSNASTVVISVTGVNDAPVVANPLPDAQVEQGADDLGIDLSTTFFDVDNAFNMAAFSSDGSLVTAKLVGTQLTLHFPPSESGVATVTVSANDGVGGVVSTSFEVTVNNVVPSLIRLASSAAMLEEASADGIVTLDGEFVDLGFDTHTAIVNWGDGSAAESIFVDQAADLFAGQHEYAHGGIFTIHVTLEDSNGAVAEATTQAVVEGVGLVGKTLYIIGTDEDDDIELEVDSKRNEIEVEAKFGHGRQSRKIEKEFDADQVDRVIAYLFGGDDRYEIEQKPNSHSRAEVIIPQLIFGGEGKDRIEADRDYAGPLEIHGQAGDDRITGGGADDILHGDEGDDRIDGGPGNDIIFGGEGDDRLEGGYEGRREEGNDIIIGGAGDDRIEGGRGRDLLIGGLGQDDIRGNSGGDLLIGGFAAYEQSLDALLSLRAEWTADREYEERINNLRGGTGPILAGTGIQLKGSGPDATVFDDNARDRLWGGSGSDWFFAQLAAQDDDDKVKKSKYELIDLLDD